jgi:hypothetical protein
VIDACVETFESSSRSAPVFYSTLLQTVIPFRIDAVDMAHRAAEIPARRVKEEMIMIPQQAIPMNHEPKSFMRFSQGSKKHVVIGFSRENTLPATSTTQHMIIRIVVFYPDGSGHKPTINESIS